MVTGTPVLNYSATNVAPTQKDKSLLSRRREYLISKHINGLESNKSLFMGPNKARNQEWLCWRGPAAIYCYATKFLLSMSGAH
jgi:hypothetical protein